MNVHANSIDAWNTTGVQRTVAECEREIERWFRERGRAAATRRQCADALGLEYGFVSARVCGLMAKSRLIGTGQSVESVVNGRRTHQSLLLHVDHAPGYQGVLEGVLS